MEGLTEGPFDPALVEDIIQSRSGGKVERCHAMPKHGSYNNAQHQWGVAMLMYYLWPEDFGRLGIYCLTHDVAEAWVGDVPATTLRYVPGLRQRLGDIESTLNRNLGLPGENELGPEDHAKLKACDRLELYLWCREQIDLGNKFAQEFINELSHFIRENPLPEVAQALFEDLEGRDSVVARQAGVMREVMED
jgi:5'-deoxynucleotidase YfbR-like HD superfamily hydrolase